MGNSYQLKINISKTNRIDLVNNLMLVSVNKIEQVRMKIIEWRYEQARNNFSRNSLSMLFKNGNRVTKISKIDNKII